MEAQASLSSDGSLVHMDEAAAQKACMAFSNKVRAAAKVSVMRANHEAWSDISWARKLELVKAEAVSLRAASDAAFEALLSSTARPDFDRDLPSSSDVILSCAASADDFCITLEAVEKPQRSAIHCIVVLDVSGSMDHSATQRQSAGVDSQERQVQFSRLQLAQHSSKVIVEVMGDEDSVTILSFGSEARVRLPKTCMTQEGKLSLKPRCEFAVD